MDSIKQFYTKLAITVMKKLRPDLQLHFFWSFFLTMLSVFYQPLIYLGLFATVTKEALDLWTKGHWSWDDFWFGVFGWLLAVYFLGL